MPAYVSHTIMARDVYDKIHDEKVNLEYMLTFSLGGDLCKYAKCRYDSHHKDQEKFIYNMCDYMKENKLINDGECLGVLYGHICHYIMDDMIHPLIRKVDKTCVKNKKNHTLIEGYIDSYLVKKKYGLRVDKYDNKKLLGAKVDKKVTKMINYAYEKTYNCKNVGKYYKFNLWLYRKIKYLYKIFGVNGLKKLSGFNKFIEVNKNIDIFNEKEKITYKDYLGKECNDSLITSYDKAITRAVNYICKIYGYLNEDSEVIYNCENQNNFKVIEYTDLLGNKIRKLVSHNATYSSTLTGDNNKYHIYFKYFQLYDIPLRIKNNINDSLLLGAGCFTFPKHYISKYLDKKMDAVEIDNELIDIAYKYFYLDDLYNDFDKKKERLKIYNQDAYNYVLDCNKKYDLIFLDVFIDTEPVLKFLTLDFIEKILKILNKDGIFAVNYILNYGKEEKFRDFLKILKSVFKYVEMLTIETSFKDNHGNIYIMAMNKNYKFDESNFNVIRLDESNFIN